MSGWFSRLRRRFGRSKPIDLGEPVSPAWDAVTERARSDMEARQAALASMTGIVGAVSAALNEADPARLGKTLPGDEYDSEAETIVLRLADRRRLSTVEEVREIVHEEFTRWFGPDIAGPSERYAAVAEDVHRLWGEFLAEDQ